LDLQAYEETAYCPVQQAAQGAGRQDAVSCWLAPRILKPERMRNLNKKYYGRRMLLLAMLPAGAFFLVIVPIPFQPL